MLWISTCIKFEIGNNLLAEMTAAAFSQYCIAGKQGITWHMSACRFTILADTHVTGKDSFNLALRILQQLRRCKPRQYFDTQRFGLPGQPAAELAQADNVLAGVVQVVWKQGTWNAQATTCTQQVVQLFAPDRSGDWCVHLPPVGKQLVQSTGVKNGAGKDMGADFGSFFNDADAQFPLCLPGKLGQAACGGKPGRSGADDQHIKVHAFAFRIVWSEQEVGPDCQCVLSGIIIAGSAKRPNIPVVQPMKILVPVKRTIDAYVKARVLADQSGVDLANTKMALNPFCEIAVEEAVRIREKGLASEVIAVSVGSDKVQEQLRTAMALGADRCIHVQAADQLEPINIAKLLQAVVANENPGLVILGKQAIDSDDNQVGQMLAALCGLPQATFASSLEFAEGSVMVSREIDGGEQVLRLTLPAVVTTDLRLNEPRYAKLPDIMKAKKKPVDITTPEQLGVALRSHVVLLKASEPPVRKAGIRVSSVAELVDKLRNAGVLG